jgi:two-component system, cell cycle sensor histidine kinase and response regulator CckA
LFRALVDQSSDTIEVLDPETGRFLDVNERGCLDLGYSREEVLALRVFDIDPMVNQSAFTKVTEELRKSRVLMWQGIHRRKDGSTFPVEVNLKYVQLHRDYMVAVVRDITERKQAEAALRDSEARLMGVVDSAMDGIVTIDDQERILVFNTAAEEMFGCPAAEAIGGPVERFIPERFRATHHGHLQRFGQMRKTKRAALQFRRVGGLRASGEEFPIEASISRTEVDGQLLFTIILRDITERVRHDEARARLETQLRLAQKMEALGTLAGGIAHDFNNILGAIIGNIELARQDVGPSHPAMESIEEISKASHRAKDLVQRILTFTNQRPEPQSVIPLRPLVEEAVTFLRATLPAGVEIAATVDADAPTVLADSTQIHQVLINLCINAWHAMEGHAGRIDIRLDGITLGAEAARADANLRPGHFARLCVTDTGTGMEAATLERMFEPFFTTKPVGQGTGLGLSVVHGIVKAHGGGITVTSQPGRGTTFSLYFPAVEAPEASAAPEGATAEPRPAAGGQHVLYLDDDEPLVFLVTRMLERLGYRVSGYTRAEEALAAVRADQGQFDLVVTDLNMPGMSGLDVARELAHLRPDLPVVLTSGYVTEELRAQASAAGVRHVIYKPDTVDGLCDAVQRLAGEPKRP